MVKILPSKISIPPTIQYYLENPAFLNACFSLFPLTFLFQTLESPTWPRSSCDFAGYELTKYNGFQITGNKPDKTPYLIQ